MYVFTVLYSLVISFLCGIWLGRIRTEEKQLQKKKQLKQINDDYRTAYGDRGPGWHR